MLALRTRRSEEQMGYTQAMDMVPPSQNTGKKSAHLSRAVSPLHSPFSDCPSQGGTTSRLLTVLSASRATAIEPGFALAATMSVPLVTQMTGQVGRSSLHPYDLPARRPARHAGGESRQRVLD